MTTKWVHDLDPFKRFWSRVVVFWGLNQYGFESTVLSAFYIYSFKTTKQIIKVYVPTSTKYKKLINK